MLSCRSKIISTSLFWLQLAVGCGRAPGWCCNLLKCGAKCFCRWAAEEHCFTPHYPLMVEDFLDKILVKCLHQVAGGGGNGRGLAQILRCCAGKRWIAEESDNAIEDELRRSFSGIFTLQELPTWFFSPFFFKSELIKHRFLHFFPFRRDFDESR